MTNAVFRRDEFHGAMLDLGSVTIDLEDYMTTGLRVAAVAPSGAGKTNVGALIAEQLAAQGWMSVLLDPEGELASLYPVVDAGELEAHLTERAGPPIVVVPVRDAEAFVPVGETITRVVDVVRKPVFLGVDEGQVFSTSRRQRKDDILRQASDVLTNLAARARKRCHDLFFTAPSYASSLSRGVFGHINLTFIGRHEDAAAWSALAPKFKGSGLMFADINALQPGEFFCFSRRGVEKVTLPMAAALRAVAPAVTAVRASRPRTFAAWDAAMRDLPTERLRALTGDKIALLGTIVGLTPGQLAAGTRALQDELATR